MTTQKKLKKTSLNSRQENIKEDKPTVTPLLMICINFVAENLHLVDTFYGLPDILGEKIFHAAMQHGKFDILADGSHFAMSIFTSVYCDLVLFELNLCGEYLGLNYCMEHLSLFTYIQKLDISDCGLGDDHEYLEVIAQMNGITDLCLRNNSLSDKGIQKLTTPYRVFNRGPSQLNIFDISENEDVTSKGISYLNSFNKLDRIDITGTKVKSCESLLRSWNFQPFKVSTVCDIYTKGWAAKAIEEWMKTAATKATSRKTMRSKISKFYSKSVLTTEMKSKQDNIKLKTDKRFRLLLVRKEHSPCQKPGKNSISCLIDQKRNMDDKVGKLSKHENRQTYDSKSSVRYECETEDQELMKTYTILPQQKSFKKTSLWESMNTSAW